MALTNERIIQEIQEAIKLNGESKVKTNEALTHAMTAIQNMDKRLAEKYEVGCHDGWEFARMIREVDSDSYTTEELFAMFGTTNRARLLGDYTYEQINEKVKAHIQKKEEEVATKPVQGDEVLCSSGCAEFKGIFYGEGCTCYYVLDPTSPAPQSIGKDWKLFRTGKHVDLF